MNEFYEGQQFVGMDLHRRRSVLVRMTETGEHTSPSSRSPAQTDPSTHLPGGRRCRRRHQIQPGVDLVQNRGQHGLRRRLAFRRESKIRPNDERHIVVRVVAHERVEPRKLTAVVVHGGVRPEALVGDPVPVLLSVGRRSGSSACRLSATALEVGVEDLARDQSCHPRGQVVGR